jgi:hypothetical protein
MDEAALVALLHGRAKPTEPVTKPTSSGFDGGCRTPVPPPRDPVREHDETVISLVHLARTFGSRGF